MRHNKRKKAFYDAAMCLYANRWKLIRFKYRILLSVVVVEFPCSSRHRADMVQFLKITHTVNPRYMRFFIGDFPFVQLRIENRETYPLMISLSWPFNVSIRYMQDLFVDPYPSNRTSSAWTNICFPGQFWYLLSCLLI